MIFFKISGIISTVGAALVILGAHSPVISSEATHSKIKVGSVGSLVNLDLNLVSPLRIAAAYFRKINDDGGISGHDVDLVSYDDEGNLRRTLDLTRKLVEVDKVTLLFRMNKKANDAIGPYVRFKKVPQLFDIDPDEDAEFVATPPEIQGKFFGEYILKEMPSAKIAIIHEDSRSGNEFLTGFYDGLGNENARSMITNMDGDRNYLGNRVSRVSGHNADFLVIFGQPDFQIGLLKQATEVNWKPTIVMSDAAVSIALEKIKSHIGVFSLSNQRIPLVMTSAENEEWEIFRSRYLPGAISSSTSIIGAYLQARSTVALLQSCVDNLTSGCLQRNFEAMPTERLRYRRALHLMHFTGESWDTFVPETRY